MRSPNWPGSFLSRHYRKILLFLVFVVALVVRLIGLSVRPFWYDELQSMVYSHLPLGDMLQSVIIFDPHPPLYYFQLHFWLLVSTSEEWARWNSVVWSLLAAAALYILCRKLFTFEFAICSTLIFVVMPMGVFYAQEVRMYSMLMCLAVGSFYFAYHFLNIRQGPFESLGLFVFTGAFLYTHGSGFLLLISLVSYSVLVWLADRKINRKIFYRFLFLLGSAALLYVLWLIKGFFFSMEHLQRPGLKEMVDTLSNLIIGFLAYPTWLQWLAILLVVPGVLYAFFRGGGDKIRPISTAFLLIPVLFCLLISFFLKPIWHYRSLIYTLPFLSMMITWIMFRFSAWVGRRKMPAWVVRYIILESTVLLLFAGSLAQQYWYSYPWDIHGTANQLRCITQPGDVVYVVHPRLFWGINWYWGGPENGFNPLGFEYSVLSPKGVYLLYPLDTEAIVPGHTYWIVYRDTDSIDPLSPDDVEVITTFNHVVIARLRSP
jgi:mannosyltransferase